MQNVELFNGWRRVILEIDDAGSGSPVGGIIIGGRKGDKYSYRIIPVNFFQDMKLSNDAVRKEVLRVVKQLLLELRFDPKEDAIRICRGEIFSMTKQWFDEQGYQWMPVKIESHLQDYVEGVFDLHLIQLGIPRMLVKRMFDYRDYVILPLKWVVLKRADREHVVKKRFKIWRQEWACAEITFARETANKRIFCNNCGGVIRKATPIYLAKITTPKRVLRAYLHPECKKALDLNI